MKKMFTECLKRISSPLFLLYLVKCLIGALICYMLYLRFPEYQLHWSIVSVLLVLAPDHIDSFHLAIARMKANIIGASVGLLFLRTLGTNAYSLCFSIVLTILICTFFGLEAPTRTALAALIIVLITSKEKDTWHIGVYRMISVIFGCLVAILLTWAFTYLTGKRNKTGKTRPQ